MDLFFFAGPDGAPDLAHVNRQVQQIHSVSAFLCSIVERLSTESDRLIDDDPSVESMKAARALLDQAAKIQVDLIYLSMVVGSLTQG